MKNDLISKNSSNGIFKYIKGFIIEIIAAAVFIFLFALIMCLSTAALKYAAVFATVAVAVGSFLGAFITARSVGNKGWLVGVIIGGITFIIISLISLIINRDGVTINTLFHFIIIMLASLIGGVVGVNKDNKHKYI